MVNKLPCRGQQRKKHCQFTYTENKTVFAVTQSFLQIMQSLVSHRNGLALMCVARLLTNQITKHFLVYIFRRTCALMLRLMQGNKEAVTGHLTVVQVACI